MQLAVTYGKKIAIIKLRPFCGVSETMHTMRDLCLCRGEERSPPPKCSGHESIKTTSGSGDSLPY